MARINVHKIRGKMAEKGITITRLAELLGVSRNTLSTYFKHPEKMPFSVVDKMASILCDSAEEATAIFFCNVLS